jgi:ATP-binding cassette, subfamily B, bacterial MsbA
MRNIVAVLGFGWGYLRRYWVRLTCGVVLSVIFALSNASFIWATGTLTERFSNKPAQQRNSRTDGAFANTSAELMKSASVAIDPWLPRMGRALDWRQVLGALCFLPVLVFFRSAADYLSSYCMGWVGERVIRDLRLDIMEKLSTLSLDFFTRSSTGDLLTRINVDSQTMLRTLRSSATDLLKQSFSVIALIGTLFWLDWKLTLMAMLLIPALALPMFILGKKARKAMKATLRGNIWQSSQLIELLGGIRVIKSFNLEREEIARFRRTSSKLVHAGMQGIKAKELVNPVIEVIAMFGFGLLLIYIFATGRTGAELASFLTATMLFFLSMKKLASVHIAFEQANVAVQRLIEILNEKPKVVEPIHPKPFNEFRSAITFEDVTFAYGEKEVVRQLDLTIPRGFRLGLAGESGSGKTTIVNLLFRFYDPTSGSIKIDGLDLRQISLRDLRQQMALVSQEVILFDQTIAENIAAGKLGATREEIEAAAKAAFAHDFIMQECPEGYDTRVGERGVNLSGGQRQRLCIARAFIRNAPILVLDEATASLDSKAEAEVQAAIDRLAEHRTVICIAHRLSTLSGMDKILVLGAGKIVEAGGFGELLKKGGLFSEMAARQGIFPPSVR